MREKKECHTENGTCDSQSLESTESFISKMNDSKSIQIKAESLEKELRGAD